ncbi:MAG: 30S ribosomal protein S4e [Candidatus Aenigmarchaeota archaeon]
MKALKRYSMPKHWRVPRKTYTWVVSSIPGPHRKEDCLPLQMVVRDVLKLADNAKEAKKIIFQGKILIDKKPKKEPGHPVGIMDIIEIPEAKKFYRVLASRSGMELKNIKAEAGEHKLCRIEGKKNVKGGMTQLNLHDGRNLLMKGGKEYGRGDALVIHLPDQKIIKHIKFAKGAEALIIAGRNRGNRGKIKEIKVRKNMLEKSTVTLQAKEREILTPLNYVMIIDGPAHREAKK